MFVLQIINCTKINRAMNNDEIICTCMGVDKGTIVEAIKTNNLKTVEEVGEATDAGTVCGGCQDDIQKILNEVNGK